MALLFSVSDSLFAPIYALIQSRPGRSCTLRPFSGHSQPTHHTLLTNPQRQCGLDLLYRGCSSLTLSACLLSTTLERLYPAASSKWHDISGTDISHDILYINIMKLHKYFLGFLEWELDAHQGLGYAHGHFLDAAIFHPSTIRGVHIARRTRRCRRRRIHHAHTTSDNTRRHTVSIAITQATEVLGRQTPSTNKRLCWFVWPEWRWKTVQRCSCVE
jgi:hypothetical protein